MKISKEKIMALLFKYRRLLNGFRCEPKNKKLIDHALEAEGYEKN